MLASAAEAVPGPYRPAWRTNTAGEPEREAHLRRANLIEAFSMMFLLLGALWFLAYLLGVVGASPAARLASRGLIGALVVFAALISPRWHRDSLQSWGLGNPVALFRAWRRARPWKRALYGGLGVGVVGLLTLELFLNATGMGRFVLGVEPAFSLRLQDWLGGKAVVLVLCCAVSLVWVTCIIRYDNAWPALKAAGCILGCLLPITFLVAWVCNGPAVFVQGNPQDLALNGLGYIFWGALQQLVFCSYFGTRLRKGFAPASHPALRPWKRLAVAVLNGLFFALIHLNNWPLVGFAWLLGCCLSWVFMQDRYRNLQAVGLVHGILGVCVIWLFAGNPAPLHVRLRVGPWSMPHHLNLTTLLVVGLLMLGFALSLALLARSHPAGRR